MKTENHLKLYCLQNNVADDIAKLLFDELEKNPKSSNIAYLLDGRIDLEHILDVLEREKIMHERIERWKKEHPKEIKEYKQKHLKMNYK